MSRLLVMLCANLCMCLINFDTCGMDKDMVITFPSPTLLRERLVRSGLNELLIESLGLHNCLGNRTCMPRQLLKIIDCAWSRCSRQLKICPKFALMHAVLKDNENPLATKFRLSVINLSLQYDSHEL